MSTGPAIPPPRFRRFLTPTHRMALTIWAVVMIVLFMIWFGFQDPQQPVKTKRAAAEPAATGARSPAAASPQTESADPGDATAEGGKDLASRLAALEEKLRGLEPPTDRFGEKASEAQSRQAVVRAKASALTAGIEATRARLQKLKSLQTEWEAKSASLMTGEPGRRIAGSPPHLEMAADLLEQPRPTADELRSWELQLAQLAEPIELSPRSKDRVLVVAPEHEQMLGDLGQRTTSTLAELERQLLLVKALLEETATVAPAAETLSEALATRRAADEQARAEQLAAARESSRAAAEKAQRERIAALAQQLIEAETRREEAKLQAEKERIAKLAEQDRARAAEETRVMEAAHKAEMDGLEGEAARIAEALQHAQLEREFERDLPQIRSFLAAFLADGFENRQDGMKGPASLSFLRADGVLNPGLPGLERLLFCGCAKNDRPRGALPWYIGGDLRSTSVDTAPAEKAQALLNKYGELMVEKGLLAK